MFSKRLAHMFLVGTGFCVLSTGCAAVNALVTSPYGDDSSSPARLTAIGRVFENQGHYAQAQTMYRRALKNQPGNLFAKERLQYIAARKASRTFKAAERKTAEAVAVADSVETRRNTSNARKTGAPGVVSVAQVAMTVTDHESENSLDSKLTQESLPEIADSSEPENIPVVVPERKRPVANLELEKDTAEPLVLNALVENEPVPEDILPPADYTSEDGQLPSEFGNIELANLTSDTEDPDPVGLVFAPAAEIAAEARIDQIAFDADADSDQETWQSTTPKVSLAETLRWIDSPADFQNELLTALKHGEDDGVRALAAAALAGCPADNAVDEALRGTSKTDAAFVKVTALESLTERGSLVEGDVQAILVLAANDDADIRAQAASGLRNLTQTEWSRECVAGLGTLLDDTDVTVVVMAITTLGDFGAAAIDYRDAIADLSKDQSDWLVSEAATHALTRITDTRLTVEQADSGLPADVDPGTSSDSFLPDTEE